MEKSLEQNYESFYWDNSLGRGFLDIKKVAPYNDAYFEKYWNYSRSDMGRSLSNFRSNTLKKYSSGMNLDIGIGCGDFIETHGFSKGYDICERARLWLKDRFLYVDPYTEKLDHIASVTFFDSLEHIRDIEGILKLISGKVVVISIPIFDGLRDAVASKHFRADEHFHYFTREGLISLMGSFGFKLQGLSDGESRLGREGILTFSFLPK